MVVLRSAMVCLPLPGATLACDVDAGCSTSCDDLYDSNSNADNDNTDSLHDIKNLDTYQHRHLSITHRHHRLTDHCDHNFQDNHVHKHKNNDHKNNDINHRDHNSLPNCVGEDATLPSWRQLHNDTVERLAGAS